MVPVVLGLVWFAPVKVFAVAAALLAIGTLREYLDLADKAGLSPIRWPAYAMTGLLVVLPVFGVTVALDGIFVLVVLTLIMAPRRELAGAAGGSASTIFGVLYTGLPFLFLVNLRDTPNGHLQVVGVLLIVWVGDTAAYYGGRWLGRHKLAPRVSPGKTWEGAVSSVVVAGVAGCLYMKYALPHLPLVFAAFIAVTVNIAGQLGDLAESALKRGAGVKDSGTLLPGHGGLLDRVDALLFAIPVLWYDYKVLAFLFPN